MDLVDVGQGTVLLRQGNRAWDVGDVAVHGIDALEGDQLRRSRIGGGEQFLEVGEVIVPEDVPGTPTAPDARDHRVVVQRVGEDDETRKDLVEGRERGLVGDIARGEEQGRFLAVQVGEFELQLHMIAGRAGDVPGSARAGAGLVDGRLHGVQHHRVLALGQVVVGAPDHDLGGRAVRTGPGGIRKTAAMPLQVGKNPIPAFRPDLV